MDEPRTDPRSPGPVPPHVLGAELHRLRRELHEAACAWEVLAHVETHPQRRAVALAMQRLCFRALNAGNAMTTAPPVPRWLRVWRALVG